MKQAKRKLKEVETKRAYAVQYPEGGLDSDASSERHEDFDPGYKLVRVRIIRERDWQKREKLLKEALELLYAASYMLKYRFSYDATAARKLLKRAYE